MSNAFHVPRRPHAALIAFLAAAICTTATRAQAPPDPNFRRQQIFRSYQAFKDELASIVAILDAAERTARLDAFWKQLQSAGQIPYTQDGEAAFLFRGAAKSVAWAGDFNEWKPDSPASSGVQMPGTDLWILEKKFPQGARLDYKIVVDGSSWILDPANSLQMWSGLGGPNSELRMPDYKYPQETARRPGVDGGQLTGNITVHSKSLGYDVNYRVYTPAGYDPQQAARLPVVYVTDGHEYAADYLGSMVVVLDNLITHKSIQPTMAVFIDPRDPKTGANRRMTEYVENASFAAFLADELVPRIDGAYRTHAERAGRTILGTSLGGLNSAYIGATRSDAFGNIAVQSPASFSRFAPQTLDLYRAKPLANSLHIFISAGTMGDGDAGPTFAATLTEGGYDYAFVQVHEGHSWGNCRALLDDILIELIGPTPPAAND